MNWESLCPLVTWHHKAWLTPWPARCPWDHPHSQSTDSDRIALWDGGCGFYHTPGPAPGAGPGMWLCPSWEEPWPGLLESPERLLVAWLERWKQMKLTDKCRGLWQRPLTGGRLAVGGLMETDPDGSRMRRWITLMEPRRGRTLRQHYSEIIWFLFVLVWGGRRDAEPHSPWSFS